MSIQDILFVIFFPWSATFGLNIFVIILGLIDQGLGFIVSFFPDSQGLPSQISDSFNTIISYMKMWDFFIPITEFFSILTFVVGYKLTKLGLQIYFKVANFIRGVK